MLYIALALLAIFCCAVIFIVADDSKDETSKHTVFYDPLERKLTLDNYFVLASFRNGSLNHKLFEYLNNKKEVEISIDDLSDVIRGRSIDLNKVVDAMGFRGDLKRLLFTHSSEKITYHPGKLENFIGLISMR